MNGPKKLAKLLLTNVFTWTANIFWHLQTQDIIFVLLEVKLVVLRYDGFGVVFMTETNVISQLVEDQLLIVMNDDVLGLSFGILLLLNRF